VIGLSILQVIVQVVQALSIFLRLLSKLYKLCPISLVPHQRPDTDIGAQLELVIIMFPQTPNEICSLTSTKSCCSTVSEVGPTCSKVFFFLKIIRA